ncbi:hypothetical protein [Nocardia sp. NPDC050710]|uniref:hypothetical protein n=1 Tax=Nocardia sp. NPDC050710 TaxID=3157220 RepID=UPI003407D2D1
MSGVRQEQNLPDVLEQSRRRVEQAKEILARLRLFERWGIFGTPVLVGAVAYELAMAPDIDMEIYCDEPRIEDGFAVLRECAVAENGRKARFGNYLDEVDEGLYWRLDYRADDGTDGGIHSSAHFAEWLAAHPRDHLTFWKPGEAIDPTYLRKPSPGQKSPDKPWRRTLRTGDS